MRVRTPWLLLLGLALLTGTRASGQALSPGHTVALSATKVSTISVSPTANATQSIISINDGITDFGPGPVGLTTEWDVNPGQVSSIRMVGYFSSATSALTAGAGADILPGEVEALMSTVAGMSWTKFAQAAVIAGTEVIGTTGATVLFWEVPITELTKKMTRSDQLALRLNLAGRGALLPVGTYTGTLYLRAVAY